MDWTTITDALWGLFALVLIAIIGALGVIAKSLIDKGKEFILAKIDTLKDESAQKAAKSALATVDKLAMSAVTSLEQEYAQAIRESLKNNDGKFTRDDLLALHSRAVTTVWATMSDSVADAAASIVGDLGQYISDKVSEDVYLIKESNSN